jgi:hypothetical protein
MLAQEEELAARKRQGDEQLVAAARLQQDLLQLATQFEADRAMIQEQQDMLDLSLETVGPLELVLVVCWVFWRRRCAACFLPCVRRACMHTQSVAPSGR